jgi:hypothetical protein
MRRLKKWSVPSLKVALETIAGFLVIPKGFFCLIRQPDKDYEPHGTMAITGLRHLKKWLTDFTKITWLMEIPSTNKQLSNKSQ